MTNANDMIAALTFDPAAVETLVTDALTALETDQNVIIRTTRRGIGLLHRLADALKGAALDHAIYAADALDVTDIKGIPYVKDGEIVYAEPFFVREFTQNNQKVLVLDEVQGVTPSIGEFIRDQKGRGRMILIFSNDYDFHLYDDFPAVRLMMK